tara:strand:- start:70 stop:429 length:360 start_codon:yes stop_codon:yes gene_type:complete
MKLQKDLYCYEVKEIVKVVDGDTVDVILDLGFDVHIKKRIRLNAINAHESRTRDKKEKKKGLAAKARLIELCNEGNIIVKSCGIGKYGRLLGELYTRGANINNILLSEGHAVRYDGGKK